MTRRPPALVLIPVLALAGCTTQSETGPAVTTGTASGPDGASPGEPVDGGAPRTAGETGPAATALPDPGPLAAALALAPQDTAYLTVTDWSRIKQRLGAADLTGESLQTDRSEFWRAVPASTVLLTDGALRAENSRLGLRHGLTQDDVTWEVRWVSPEGSGAADGGGLALRLRDDLDLSGLHEAVRQEVPGVAGAEVLVEEHLLLRDAATGAPLAAAPAVTALVDTLGHDAETMLAAPGCLTWPDALGVDATVDQQESVAQDLAVDDLLEPQAWGMAFAGREATVTVVYPDGVAQEQALADARVRLDLAEAWPTTESVGWPDAFGLPPGLTGDGVTVSEVDGRTVASADYRVVNPTAAATVALSGTVPWGVCAEIAWLAEPTGL